MTTTEYAKALGNRLRAIRQQQGLSLQKVEQKSQGRWKAVVIGSYERGDRAVTVARLAELAEFYGVPLNELLPESDPRKQGEPPAKLMIDLTALASLEGEDMGPLSRYIASIQSQRGDYNGRVLTIRQEDLRALAAIYDASPAGLAENLTDWGVLRTEDGHGRDV